MNRHNHKPTVYTVHLDRAMSRAKYMASHPNKQTVKTWAGHMLAHFDECARLGDVDARMRGVLHVRGHADQMDDGSPRGYLGSERRIAQAAERGHIEPSSLRPVR